MFVEEAVGSEDDTADGVVQRLALVDETYRVAIDMKQSSGTLFDGRAVQLCPKFSSWHDDGTPARRRTGCGDTRGR